MKEYAVFWLANGFDPYDPAKVDIFSRHSLENALTAYRDLKSAGEKVWFPIINSAVKDATAKHILRNVLWNEAIKAGVDKNDMVLTAKETTGSPTDGLAITRFSKEYPNAIIGIYTTLPEAAAYFEVMYKATAQRIENHELYFSMYPLWRVSATFPSRLIYTFMRWATILANQTGFTFKLWWNFLDFAYSWRLKGFSRTVK